MSVVTEFTEDLQIIIKELLERDAKYRDSDRKILAKLWSMQVGGSEATKNISLYEFLTDFIKEDSSFISMESAGRARRKIQEENPLLRGKRYRPRKDDGTDEMKNRLGYTP